jgi:V-type H+-transporting ATPase subunit C
MSSHHADQQVYTLVSVPFRSTGEQQRSAQFANLQSALGAHLGPVARLFMIPNLKVGTLDSLLEASDELQKLDPQLEGSCFKLAGILEDVSGSARQAATMLRINPQSNDVSSDYFLKDFSWNSAMYDPKESISNLLQKFAHVVSGAEERTRQSLTDYSELKNKLINAGRRNTGSLAVRPIGDLVKKWCHAQGLSAPVDSEFLVTLFVAVPKSHYEEWGKTYTKLHDFVVPKSSTVVASDNEIVLCSLVVFKKAAEDVKLQCRKLKYVVRDVVGGEELSENEVVELEKKAAADKAKLTLLLAQQYTHCFVAWIHAKAVRVFVESMLRFGLPPKFVPVLIAADAKKEDDIRSKLAQLYQDYANKYQKGEEGGVVDAGALVHDYPYVCLKVANILKAR